MDPRMPELTKQFKGIVEGLEKSKAGASVSAALLALIASLLFVLIDQGEEEKMRYYSLTAVNPFAE